MLIDTHCHLDYEYDEGRTALDLIQTAKNHGVSTFITIGTEPENFERVQKISETFPEVYHTIGVHPHEASRVDESVLNHMKQYLSHPKCVAVGEIGLDYYYEHSDREKQKQECRSQIDLALEFQKPLVIHSRDGEEDLLPILTNYAKRFHEQTKRAPSLGVIHCFSGTEKFAQACIDLGFYISFSGIFTFKNSESLRQMAYHFPIERLLVETDAPFLAPVPLRGKKCEPYMVKHTALKLAEVLKINFDELAIQTSRNARTCFGLPIES